MRFAREIVKKLGLFHVVYPAYTKYNYLHAMVLGSFYRKLIIRKGTSDLETYGQIFVIKEYAFDLGFSPKFMIDAGANVGYTCVYFKNRYPELEIITLEPEETNFEVLEENVSSFSGIRCLQQGLWHKATQLVVEDIGLGKWGFIVKEVDDDVEGSISATTVDLLLEESRFDHIDILKIDIEGSEKEVFENAGDWLDRVNVIFVETHDRFKEGSQAAVYGAIDKTVFHEHKDGENLIFVRKQLLH